MDVFAFVHPTAMSYLQGRQRARCCGQSRPGPVPEPYGSHRRYSFRLCLTGLDASRLLMCR